MRFDHLHHHLDRRQLLKAGAAGVAATAVSTSRFAGLAGASTPDPNGNGNGGGGATGSAGSYDDSFSIEGALDGSWAADTSARYGADDERGTLNEITPAKTASALGLLDTGNVKTVIMAHTLRNGFPAYRTFPPRRYQQRATVLGFEPADPSQWFSTTTTGFEGEDEWRRADRERGPLGYFQGPTPLGPNKLSVHEERFPEGGTYQIATQLDGLPHIGVGDIFYNGYRGSDIAQPWGVSKLGIEQVGPIVTRGIVIDVLGWKQQRCAGDDVLHVGGNPVLSDTYRITVADLQETMKWQGTGAIEAGDVVLVRTGWHALADLALDNDDEELFNRYLDAEPGIYLAEAKFLAENNPAIIGSDGWGLEVVGYTGDPAGWAFPVHSELIPKRGIRIGESIITDELAEEGVHEFVYCYMPNHAKGATAGCTAPFALVNA